MLAAVTALADEDITLLVFPAGYFQVRDAVAQRRLQRDLAARLDGIARTFGIVVGVDRYLPDSTKRAPTKSSADGRPFYALYRSRSGTWITMKQVSVTKSEGAADVVAARWRDRNLLLPETNIAFLICGESWSDVLLDRVATSGCRALAVAGHRNVNMHRTAVGYGRLSWHLRLHAFSRRHRVPIVLAEHTRSPDRHPYSWPAAASAGVRIRGVPERVTLRIATC